MALGVRAVIVVALFLTVAASLMGLQDLGDGTLKGSPAVEAEVTFGEGEQAWLHPWFFTRQCWMCRSSEYRPNGPLA